MLLLVLWSWEREWSHPQARSWRPSEAPSPEACTCSRPGWCGLAAAWCTPPHSPPAVTSTFFHELVFGFSGKVRTERGILKGRQKHHDLDFFLIFNCLNHYHMALNIYHPLKEEKIQIREPGRSSSQGSHRSMVEMQPPRLTVGSGFRVDPPEWFRLWIKIWSRQWRAMTKTYQHTVHQVWRQWTLLNCQKNQTQKVWNIHISTWPSKNCVFWFCRPSSLMNQWCNFRTGSLITNILSSCTWNSSWRWCRYRQLSENRCPTLYECKILQHLAFQHVKVKVNCKFDGTNKWPEMHAH